MTKHALFLILFSFLWGSVAHAGPSREERELLARFAFAESGGQSARTSGEGRKLHMALIARTVLNRATLVRAKKVPASAYGAKSGSLRDLIHAEGQYQSPGSGVLEWPLPSSEGALARDAVNLALHTSRLRRELAKRGLGRDEIARLLAATSFKPKQPSEAKEGAGGDSSPKDDPSAQEPEDATPGPDEDPSSQRPPRAPLEKPSTLPEGTPPRQGSADEEAPRRGTAPGAPASPSAGAPSAGAASPSAGAASPSAGAPNASAGAPSRSPSAGAPSGSPSGSPSAGAPSGSPSGSPSAGPSASPETPSRRSYIPPLEQSPSRPSSTPPLESSSPPTTTPPLESSSPPASTPTREPESSEQVTTPPTLEPGSSQGSPSEQPSSRPRLEIPPLERTPTPSQGAPLPGPASGTTPPEIPSQLPALELPSPELPSPELPSLASPSASGGGPDLGEQSFEDSEFSGDSNSILHDLVELFTQLFGFFRDHKGIAGALLGDSEPSAAGDEAEAAQGADDVAGADEAAGARSDDVATEGHEGHDHPGGASLADELESKPEAAAAATPKATAAAAPKPKAKAPAAPKPLAKPSSVVAKAKGPLADHVRAGKLLQLGDTGEAVKDLQRRIGVKQTGTLGPTTLDVLQKWQRSHGVEATGKVGPTTLERLERAAHAGKVIYRGYRVSDPKVRVALQRLAEVSGKDVVLTSGDRSHVPQGGSTTSLHLHGRAADFYVPGLMEQEVLDLIRRHRGEILAGGSFEVIYHGPNTNTGGIHIHLGRLSGGGHRFSKENFGVYTRVP